MSRGKPNKPADATPTSPGEGEQEDLAAAPGLDVGELEERAADAETRAEAAERRTDALAKELEELKQTLAALMRSARSPQKVPDESSPVSDANWDPQAEHPVFDESQPHGLVVGDTDVAYVQDGHQFARDRHYLRTEKHRGSPRPFNPRLVGMTRPRPNQQAAADPLDWVRGRD